MWKRKELKLAARGALKRNYWRAVIVCLIMVIFAGAYAYTTQLNLNLEQFSRNPTISSGLRWLDDMGHRLSIDEESATKGVLSGVFRNISTSGSIVFGILNAINEFVFGHSVFAGVIMLVGVLVIFAYWLFVGNLFAVGEARFFMENQHYSGTQVNRVLFIYKIRRILHVAWVLFCQLLFLFLWSFTIVGAVIKGYSYRMIPHIMAENPNISRKQAFRLSKEMMRGNKWRSFVLDLSFFGWYILGWLTLGLLSILFVNPYRAATNASLYFEIRGRHLAQNPQDAALLNDRRLVPPGLEAGTTYPVGEFSIPEAPSRQWVTQDYNRRYTPLNLVLMFFVFALVGWLWEVGIELFTKGIFVNRGTMFGPWLPLYGCAGLMVVLLLRRFADRPVLTYFLAVALCGSVEYLTGWALEFFMGQRWWDYTGYFLNINGFVCLEALIVFGFGACLGIYLLAPAVDDLLEKIPKKVRLTLAISLTVLFAADFIYSLQNPNMGEHITDFAVDEVKQGPGRVQL